MQTNPMNHGRTSNVVNQSAPLPKSSSRRVEDPDYDMFLQKQVRIKLYQEIPEIFEALTTNQIFNLRSEVTRHIAECVIETVNSDIEDIRLTKASACARLGWFVAETLLKVGLNMASQAAAGIVLDSLHEALNTHGSSPFEFNKQMKEVTFSDGSSGNVVTRRAQPWNAVNDITFDVFARQVLSDFGDESYAVVESKLSGGVLGTIKDKMSSLFEWKEKTKKGLKCRATSHDSALERMLMPIEILACRMNVVEQLIDAVVYHEMGQTAGSRGSVTTHQQVDTAVQRTKERLKRLNIHGYITYLNDLANTYIPKLSKRKIFKLILAETLVEQAPTVLSGSQVLSDSFWMFLAKKQLIAQRSESSLTDSRVSSGLTVYNLSNMDSKYASSKPDDKLWKQVNEAYYHNRLATTSNKKFGHTSGLGCFLAAELMLIDNADNEKNIIRDVHQDSSYRNYTRFLELPDEDIAFLEQAQENGVLKLSIGVAKRFYPAR